MKYFWITSVHIFMTFSEVEREPPLPNDCVIKFFYIIFPSSEDSWVISPHQTFNFPINAPWFNKFNSIRINQKPKISNSFKPKSEKTFLIIFDWFEHNEKLFAEITSISLFYAGSFEFSIPLHGEKFTNIIDEKHWKIIRQALQRSRELLGPFHY